MPSNTYPLIAREGWPMLAVLISLFLVLQYLQFNLLLTTLLLFIIFAVLYIHRDPYQKIPSLPLAIVSPVYGTVVSISDINDPFLDRPAKSIRIEMQPWDIFSLRSTVEGKVMNQWSRMDTAQKAIKACYAFWVQTDEGDHVVTSIYLDRPRWRYRFYMQSGERLGQGQRCGYVYFGSTAEVFMPVDVTVEVIVGQRVSSGSSPLALLVHEHAVSAYDGPNKTTQASA